MLLSEYFFVMRIGIDARFYGSIGKGLGRYTEKLIGYLEEIDDENEYFIFLRKENFSVYQPRNSHFKKVLANYHWYGFLEQLVFPIKLLSYRLDIVHFPHFNVPLLYPKKFIVTIHDLILLHYPTVQNTTRSILFYKIKFFFYRLVIASAIYRAKKIVAVSSFTANDIASEYPLSKSKIAVIYEAVDNFCHFSSRDEEKSVLMKYNLVSDDKKNIPEDEIYAILKPYFLYVGNAYPHKNLTIFLKIAPRFPAYTFVLVGKKDYFYTRLRENAEKENIKNILFTDFVNDQELNILYRFAVCYVFPSFYEGFGFPPLEAMIRGLPVVASSEGSIPEVLGTSAYYFNPHNNQSLEKALQEVITSSSLTESLKSSGYHQVEKYSFHRMAKETKAIYEAEK